MPGGIRKEKKTSSGLGTGKSSKGFSMDNVSLGK